MGLGLDSSVGSIRLTYHEYVYIYIYTYMYMYYDMYV